ncbi:MAG: hypothetical protein ACT4OX_10810 [Actinomycetota bacterium]
MFGSPSARAVVDRRRAYELWITCGNCGDVVVPAERCDLQVMTYLDRHSVAYRCPGCGQRDACVVTPAIANRLCAVGFVASYSEPAAELLERRPTGPPFTWDDLLTFHEQLARGDVPRP